MGVELKNLVGVFASKRAVSFKELGDCLNLRSNALAYHVRNLVESGVLVKEEAGYSLGESSEPLLPYGSALSKLPVVVLALKNEKGEFGLLLRRKRPFDGFFAMPGAKILIDESIESAAKRIAKEEAGLDLDNAVTCAVVDEHILSGGKAKNSWLMFLVSSNVKKKGTLEWFSKEQLKSGKVIQSDVWMLTNLLDERLKVHSARLEDGSFNPLLFD
ncbi:NUDIX domain-containing protein [Candidatus Woesearchaeota archaeon]|nr:NUDIX domain-containing protein [Candidatus Woesearchaeota archaeon]